MCYKSNKSSFVTFSKYTLYLSSGDRYELRKAQESRFTIYCDIICISTSYSHMSIGIEIFIQWPERQFVSLSNGIMWIYMPVKLWQIWAKNRGMTLFMKHPGYGRITLWIQTLWKKYTLVISPDTFLPNLDHLGTDRFKLQLSELGPAALAVPRWTALPSLPVRYK